MGFLPRLILTVLFFPLVIIGFSPTVFWEGYDEVKAEAVRRRKAEEVAEWMSTHPVEAAIIKREQQQQRLIEEETERRAELTARLAAEEKKRHEARIAIEAALAKPLPEKKAKLLSEMQFPPQPRGPATFCALR